MLLMVDYYRALPRKLKEMYRWALANTEAKWIVKVDDDAVASITELETMVGKEDGNKSAVMGHVRRGVLVPKSGKWADPDYLRPIYPSFANGAHGHAVTRSVAEAVVAHDGIEYQDKDVSLGIWIDEMKEQVQWIDSQYFVAHGNCHDKSKIVIGHDISPVEMRACFPVKHPPKHSNLDRQHTSIQKVVQEQVRPLSLHLSQRFDIVVKTVYAVFADLAGPAPRFVTAMYNRHLKVWNNFQELCKFKGYNNWFDSRKPCVKKSSAEDFRSSFESTISSIRSNGFDPSVSLVPVTNAGFPLNGTHRIASSIALGSSSMPIQRAQKQHTFDWYYKFFQKKGL